MNNSVRCAMCGALLPVARSVAGKWIGGLTAAGLSAKVTKSWLDRLLILGAGVLSGALVDEAARPICGSCGLR